MGTRKSARLAAVCIGAATFVAAVPVLCAELQQVGSQEAADMEDAFETTAQQTIPGYHNVIELNTLFQMALGKNVIEDAADDKVVPAKKWNVDICLRSSRCNRFNKWYSEPEKSLRRK